MVLIIRKNLIKKKISCGVGLTGMWRIFRLMGFSSCQKFNKLNMTDLNEIIFVCNKVLLDTNMIDIKILNIKNKVILYNFEGVRHCLNMPVRGQCTKTNASTRKKFNVI